MTTESLHLPSTRPINRMKGFDAARSHNRTQRSIKIRSNKWIIDPFKWEKSICWIKECKTELVGPEGEFHLKRKLNESLETVPITFFQNRQKNQSELWHKLLIHCNNSLLIDAFQSNLYGKNILRKGQTTLIYRPDVTSCVTAGHWTGYELVLWWNPCGSHRTLWVTGVGSISGHRNKVTSTSTHSHWVKYISVQPRTWLDQWKPSHTQELFFFSSFLSH